MTPFGEAVRRLRARKGVSQKEMAQALNVSPAYLSALEHGKRGLPTFDLLQRIAGYFNIIWDEAEELFLLARSSNPRIVIDTSGLPPEYTEFANRLARRIRELDSEEIARLSALLENGVKGDGKAS
ncbi:helix-turn-helix transcriptional regulator [Rhizobium bangladeshense]|uniref:Helix-turn-helix transcriptional regulator n=1 Tax=Rhizobium bangladeshense TaxID=1138189 RepID=A0ABS7LPB0_9HYPH|nr:helix-turn-helix transcriptional regulator [Rhizobium bangladeshense]MBX4869204.1 helix-turn-helix transcriptional regulator [Rhizobium bangladeshense]MBX4872959.1 helix-turn-helix transcriptional regulator [Rhizobium bangladeshense]MBX4884336.1 helix-turn-helix transcriptional regulator [Rhizobium bangladeshense]MBY3593311.1 helix-turn-helix transcriptional regulator [Rhizobium bangladeshense]